MTGPYRKGSLAEYEACHLLKQQGWIVSRWNSNPSPPDLFAARKAEILLAMVRHARRPVPDAHAVFVMYGEELDRLRTIGNPDTVKKECWVLAPPDGWKCYEVLPGGIRRVWNRVDNATATGRYVHRDLKDYGTGVTEESNHEMNRRDPSALAGGGIKKTPLAGARS